MHKHSFTCYKGGKRTCRFGFPLQLHEQTKMNDETGALEIQRNNEWVNGFNRSALIALRCNMDIKMVLSSTDCRGMLLVYVTLFSTAVINVQKSL